MKDITLIIAGGVGIYNINKWRVEFIGKKEMGLAEETLTLFYKAKDAISVARDPFPFFEEEGETRKKGENETVENSKKLDRAYIAIERLNYNADIFNKLYASRYRFKARFGEEATKPFEEIHWAEKEIIFASRMLSSHLKTDTCVLTDEEKKNRNKETQEFEKIFFRTSMKEGPINPRLNSAVENMEKFCKKLIKR